MASQSSKFQLRNGKKGQVIIIKPGNPVLKYIINTKELTCPCVKGRKSFCEHLLFYMDSIGIEPWVYPYLRIPQIRDQIRTEGIHVAEDSCREILYGEDNNCMVCTETYLSSREKIPHDINDKFYICPECGILFHLSCHRQWGKGCAACRKGHPEPKRDRSGKVEEYPALC